MYIQVYQIENMYITLTKSEKAYKKTGLHKLIYCLPCRCISFVNVLANLHGNSDNYAFHRQISSESCGFK